MRLFDSKSPGRAPHPHNSAHYYHLITVYYCFYGVIDLGPIFTHMQSNHLPTYSCLDLICLLTDNPSMTN